MFLIARTHCMLATKFPHFLMMCVFIKHLDVLVVCNTPGMCLGWNCQSCIFCRPISGVQPVYQWNARILAYVRSRGVAVAKPAMSEGAK